VFENLELEKLLKNIDPSKILRVLLIVIIGFLLVRLIRFAVRKLFEKNLNPQSRMLVSKFINWTGFFIVSLLVLSELGIELTALLGAAGILGLALGVASQKSLGNIISGFFLVAEKSFEIGDVIKVGDKTGIVHSIETLAIMLKTFDNLLIRIPNETLISAEMTNITRFPIRRQDFIVSISYKDDLQLAMDVLKSAAQENVLCLNEPNPLVLIREYGDSGISILLGVWFEKSHYVEVKNSMSLDIKRKFDEAGITIPYPHLTLYYGDEKSKPSLPLEEEEHGS
jgi:small-conductance mechanosensitive channel